MNKRIKKNILTLFVCALPFSSIAAAADTAYRSSGPITYTELASLTSAGLERTSSTAINEATGLVALNEYQQHEIAYKLLGQAEEVTRAIRPGSQALRKLLPDLNMFFLESNDPAFATKHLFSKIDRTKTPFGRGALAHRLANPTDDSDELQAYQQAVAFLLTNTQVAHNLSHTLVSIQSTHDNFLSNWSPLDAETRRMYDQLLFQSGLFKKLNTNSWALELQARTEQLAPVTHMASDLTSNAIKAAIALTVMMRIKWILPNIYARIIEAQYASLQQSGATPLGMVKTSVHAAFANFCYNFNPLTYYHLLQGKLGTMARSLVPLPIAGYEASVNEIQTTLMNPSSAALSDHLHNDVFFTTFTDSVGNAVSEKPDEQTRAASRANIRQTATDWLMKKHTTIHSDYKDHLAKINAGAHAVGATVAGMQAYGTYLTTIAPTRERVKAVQDTARRESQLHARLSAAATVVRSCQTIQSIVDTHPQLATVLPVYDFAQHSADFKKLVSLLQGSTFNEGSSYFMRSPGAIRAAYALMEKVSNEFAPMVNYIGEVDALCSVAQLMAEHRDQRVGYAFAKFIDQETPYIALEGMWNPMIDETVVVPNDIILGQDSKARGALVTGSNTGGKSTVMIEGLATAVLLAHTIGIVPAQSCSLTPFAYIGTSLKIHSDIASGMSHLKAEIERAKEIITTIGNLPAGAKAFVAIDELFEGAPGKDGAECLYTTGKHLAALPHALWVIVTQFQDNPTQLEADTDGVCKNFKVDVIKHADGRIERPYKVMAGVSQVNGIAQLLLEQALNNNQ